MPRPKILLTGAQGQVAWECLQQFPALSEVISCNHAQLDITALTAIEAVIARERPTVVINTAAYTAVDKAEVEPGLAMRVNCDGAANLAKACARHTLPLIHLSTDYVFDGEKTEAYLETDTPNPINRYGESKWQGEEAIRALWPHHIILRLSGIFGVKGHNFVKTILRLAKEREELRVVADQITCPTPAKTIATALCAIIQRLDTKVWGTYHFCTPPPISWHAFAGEIIAQARQYTPLKVKQIVAIPSHEYPVPAKRPRHSVLAVDRFIQAFGVIPDPWQAGLAEVVRTLCRA